MKRKVLVRDLVRGRKLAVRKDEDMFLHPLSTWMTTDCPDEITAGKFTISDNILKEGALPVKGPITFLRKETLRWDYIPNYIKPPKAFPQSEDFYVFVTETGQEVYMTLWDLQHDKYTPIDLCGDKCPCCGLESK